MTEEENLRAEGWNMDGDASNDTDDVRPPHVRWSPAQYIELAEELRTIAAVDADEDIPTLSWHQALHLADRIRGSDWIDEFTASLAVPAVQGETDELQRRIDNALDCSDGYYIGETAESKLAQVRSILANPTASPAVQGVTANREAEIRAEVIAWYESNRYSQYRIQITREDTEAHFGLPVESDKEGWE